jgi:uncharacterized membrane protein YgdD (TMEM256/DUF423 family)
MSRTFVLLGAVLACLGVAGGAFGAHSLKALLPADLLAVFETGVRYQMYHALALLFVGWAIERFPSPHVRRAGWLFTIGIVLFSGSLYALSLSGVRWLGAVTPLGGAALIAGWALLALGCWRARPGT